MSSVAQRVIYVGKETPGSEGTPVTVDVALRAKLDFEPKPDKITPDEDIGSFADSRHYIGSLTAEAKLTIDGYLDHVPIPLSMALGAGTVGSVVAGHYPWTFALPNATAPTFATYTVEYSDGVNHVVRSADVFAKGLEIKGEAGKSWVFTADLVGANTDYPAAVSASPVPPVSPTAMLMANTGIWIDDLYANIGVTIMPNLISFSWKLENLQHAKLFSNSLYPTGRGNNKYKATLEIIAEMEQAKINSEKAKLLNTGLTAIRIKCDPGTPDCAIDAMYMLKEVGTLDDRDGNNIVKMVYMAQKDTLGNTGRITANSTLASL